MNDYDYLKEAYTLLIKAEYILDIKEIIANSIGWEKLKEEVISRSKFLFSKDTEAQSNELISVLHQIAQDFHIKIPSIQDFCENHPLEMNL